MVPIIMHQYGFNLQKAISYVGEMCKSRIKTFEKLSRGISHSDREINRQINIYTTGLRAWMVGSLTWSFETERYFGKDGALVKETLCLRC